MARWTAKRPNEEYLEDILSAADAWRERCLLQDGSVFLDDEALWTRDNVQELKEACPPPRHGTRDTSWSFLRQQLQDKRPQIIRLAAEAVWLTDLYPTTRAGEEPSWKRTRFEELWKSSGSPPPESKHLSDQALQGVGNVPGQHWVVQHPLKFLLVMADRWKAVPHRVEIAKDPWRFVDFLNETLPRNPNRPMRNALLYLLYPDVFEPIGSSETSARSSRRLSIDCPSRSPTPACGFRTTERFTKSARSSKGSTGGSTSSMRTSSHSGPPTNPIPSNRPSL